MTDEELVKYWRDEGQRKTFEAMSWEITDAGVVEYETAHRIETLSRLAVAQEQEIERLQKELEGTQKWLDVAIEKVYENE